MPLACLTRRGYAADRMSQDEQDKLDAALERLSRRLPEKIGKFVRWINGPSSALVRIPIAIALIIGGIFSFLPIVGLWMLPLGLAPDRPRRRVFAAAADPPARLDRAEMAAAGRIPLARNTPPRGFGLLLSRRLDGL